MPRIIALFAVLLGAGCLPVPVEAVANQDARRRERQTVALQYVARHFEAGRDYERKGQCPTLASDTWGLVSGLELHRRGEPGGFPPSRAEPWARRLGQQILRLQGLPGKPGRCTRPHYGGPSTANAAAALAYALHRYGGAWSAATREAVRAAVADAGWSEVKYLHNKQVGLPAAMLLAGEALEHEELRRRGARALRAMFDRTLEYGFFEPNAPHYGGHHFPSLIFMQALRDPETRDLARTLLETSLLIQAHLYLPGGGLGAPQSRDGDGGASDRRGRQSLLPVLWLLIGDPELQLDLRAERAHSFVVAAATDYVVPPVIRSIFLDKGAGYSFWLQQDAKQGRHRTPHAVYSPRKASGVRRGRVQSFPWQAVMLPGGRAMFGVAYGYRREDLFVSSGLYTRLPDGDFAILYQYQPATGTDTDDSGERLRGGRLDDDPDDFTGEGYDYERLVHHRSALSLWDPRGRGRVRRFPETRVHLPAYAQLGGRSLRRGAWWVAEVGDVYVAFHPLGRVAAERRVGAAHVLRLPGRSGGITELSTRAEHATLEAYAADLATRHVRFVEQPLAAEFDALDADGSRTRVRLEYRPERRLAGGTPLPPLETAPLRSPFVAWDPDSRTLTLSRPGYPSIRYETRSGRVHEEISAPGQVPAAPRLGSSS